MDKPAYFLIRELTDLIDQPNRDICKKFLSDNEELLKNARGSKNNHQAWDGGYIHHVEEVMNVALVLYDSLNNLRPLEFSLSDALLVMFLHDIEKPWKYDTKDGNVELKPEMKDRKYVKRFADGIISRYGFVLNDDIRNGLQYVEGEIDDYSPGKRSMLPIGAFCHMCDVWIARGWHDHPKSGGDAWKR
jgi:hypothetical protein